MALEVAIRKMLKNSATPSSFDIEIEIRGNPVIIRGQQRDTFFRSHPKIWAIAKHKSSNPDILWNATEILRERIRIKSAKCAKLVRFHPIWLALFNDYWLADAETYHQALDCIKPHHPFESILLVDRD